MPGMTKASRKAAKIAGMAAAQNTATLAAIRKPQKTTAGVSATVNSTAGTSVKRSKRDITPKVMLGAIDIVSIVMETATATTTVTRIASAATRMVTATSEARSSYVKPLLTLVSAKVSNRAAKIAGNTTTMATRARVPTRKQRRTIVPVSATAKCFGATSVRHMNTATPMATPATSLRHGESDIANTNNASNQTHQARGT